MNLANPEIKIRRAIPVLQADGNHCHRKLTEKTCAVCGEKFQGRDTVKACTPECTTKLRSISASNRKRI